MPPEAQWFANLDSAQTRRAYQNDLKAFMKFTGIVQPEEFRTVTRGHVLAWRADLEQQGLAGATIRRKLAALASLFDYLCESNAVTHNPVKGVKRPKVESYEGKTPALGDAQARALLDAPPVPFSQYPGIATTAPHPLQRYKLGMDADSRTPLAIACRHGLRREDFAWANSTPRIRCLTGEDSQKVRR